MINENDILLHIYKDLIGNIENIKASKLSIKKIKDNINLLDNNFFDIKCNDDLFKQYVNVFDNTELYHGLITKLETLTNCIHIHIKNKCEHEWVNDSIDIDLDRSQDICYCVKCEVTKK